MMSKGTTFFKEVAKHNLERFHSECIAWGMHNFKKEFAILFIKEVTGISNINIDTIKIINTPICASAYNKKQEFWGGLLTILNYECNSKTISQQPGSLIKVNHEF